MMEKELEFFDLNGNDSPNGVDDVGYFVASADGPNDMYKGVLEGVLEKGLEISPRGKSTKEIRPAMIIFNNPRERMLTCPGRYVHPYFQIQEAIWILGGYGDVKFISYYLKNMEKYSDGKDEFHAPYGIRMREWNVHRSSPFAVMMPEMRDQLRDCSYALCKDPSSRQALMVFWNPSFDNPNIRTDDRPCNVTFQFILRNGKLDLTIYNRSNDVNWGLFNANVVQFSVMLETMALILGVSVGRQIHFSNSLHVYDAQGQTTSKVLSRNYEFNVYEIFKPTLFEMKSLIIQTLDWETVYDNLVKIDTEISIYMNDEIRRRNGIFREGGEKYDFNLLNWGNILSKSFYYYKRGEYDQAVKSLSPLEPDDIYISCMEFLARKADFELIKRHVIDRYKGEEKTVTWKKLLKILNYMERH